jgi:hypothetical protein
MELARLCPCCGNACHPARTAALRSAPRRRQIPRPGTVTDLVDRSHTLYGRGATPGRAQFGFTGAAAQPLPVPPPDGAGPISCLTPDDLGDRRMPWHRRAHREPAPRHGEQVVDVPPKLSTRTRVFTTGQGRKTDAADVPNDGLRPSRDARPSAVIVGCAYCQHDMRSQCHPSHPAVRRQSWKFQHPATARAGYK